MKLYHASQRKNLKVLTPQPTKSLDEYIGDFVFATKNHHLALMYLIPRGTPTLMNPSENPNIVICSTPEEFMGKDKGGAIYTLSDELFEKTPQEGLSDYELVSTEAVKPIKIEVFDSIIKALKEAEIAIKFVDEATFKSLIRNPKQKELIEALSSY